MIIQFQIDGITDKQADDLAVRVMEFLRDEEEILVSDYWVGDGNE